MTSDARRIILSPAAEKDLRGLDIGVSRSILTAIEGLEDVPLRGDIKKLKGREDQWRLRVGDWRVIFEIDGAGSVIYIVRILPRKEAYRG